MAATKKISIKSIGISTANHKKQVTVYLTPQNEGQDLNYVEKYTETPDNVILRCKEMIKGLAVLLPKGTFTVKIEDMECTKEFGTGWK